VLEICANQGLGRPGSAEEEPGTGWCSAARSFSRADYEHILALVQDHGLDSLRPHPDGGVEVVTRPESAKEPDRAA
jgi:hypothetical protein